MIATADIEQIYDRMLEYRQDPIEFGIDILSINPEFVWDKMVEIANSVRDNQRTAVRAAHSVSKTFTVGRIVVPWFKTCFQPSTVITTAPSDNQVRNQLWREIHAAYGGAKVPLGGKMNNLMWDVKPSEGILQQLSPQERAQWEKNFAIGFTTRPDEATEHATKMQGWHNEWLLVALDEACGMHPQIWRTVMESLIIDEHCKVIAIGNPTDPESEFAKVCYSSDPVKQEGNATFISDAGWTVITISAMDTPNYKQNRRVIPGLAGREYVERIIKKYGPNGDGTRYRVLGLFPTYKEGTYYGFKLAAAEKAGRVGFYPWDNSLPVYTASDTGDTWTATIFFQLKAGGIRIMDDYWDNEGQGIPAWTKALNSKPYTYGKEHFVGPELAAGTPGRFQTGRATTDIAASIGYNMMPVIKHSFNNGIEAARDIWDLLQINKNTCKTFIAAASGYGKEKNEATSTDEETVYYDQPAKTWHRHMMDAFRHLAVAFRYMEIGGERLGEFRYTKKSGQTKAQSEWISLG